MRKYNDMTPLPVWRQRLAQFRAYLHRTKDRRRNAYKVLRIVGRRGLTLAISLLGATLVSFGVYSIYAPGGYVVGGILLWVLQWNYGSREGSDG